MIFAFVEDGTLEIKRDLSEVRRDFEAIDVENLIVEFYDQKGTPLKAVFTKPNRRTKFLGFMLALEPNPYFGSLEEVRSHLLKVKS